MSPTTRSMALAILEKCRKAVVHLGIIAENGWISDFFSDDDMWAITRVLAHVTLTVSGRARPPAVPGEHELLVTLFDETFMEVSAPRLPSIFQRYLELFGTGCHTLVSRDTLITCLQIGQHPGCLTVELRFPIRLGDWVIYPDDTEVYQAHPDIIVINDDGSTTRLALVPMEVGSVGNNQL
jgi:hypothetical protein